jgi:hypothetical protein
MEVPKSSAPTAAFGGKSGRDILRLSSSQFDPEPT